ncbi:hypothetical protein [Streptococcus oricebi]|uniref:Uncharacterized protein n=1 Tax=Streptococcus oricebi TaxID=1547447 RepID=A0ABS5B393_9STRE|nr:hypothetical protein [Streptococcus oricebi]MBP2623307.1 hypothetical protein [Streptococcus oricebi]
MISLLLLFLILLILTFVTSFLMRGQKKRYLLLILFLLYSVSIFSFVIWVKNLGVYTLRPGESIKIEVKSLSHQTEYSSELILDNLSGGKLELTGDDSRYWVELGRFLEDSIYYDIEEQTIENSDKKVPNSPSRDVYLKGPKLIVQAKGKRVFSVTSAKKYHLIIKNLSDKPAHFEARVVNR